MKKALKVAVALHTYGGVEPETFLAWAQEMCAPRREGIERFDLVPPALDALLSRVRSILVTMAVESDYDVLIWLDHDMVWTAGDVADLALRCAQVEGVVGALFPYRSEAMRGRGFPWRAFPNTPPEEVRLGMDELLECEAVSGGFVAFWVPALRRMIEGLKDSPDPALKVTRCRGNPSGWFWDACRPVPMPYEDGSTAKDGLSNYMSDDWVLLKRMRATGTKVYAWTRPLLRHIGRKAFSVADALAQKGTAAEVEAKLRKVAAALAEEEAVAAGAVGKLVTPAGEVFVSKAAPAPKDGRP